MTKLKPLEVLGYEGLRDLDRIRAEAPDMRRSVMEQAADLNVSIADDVLPVEAGQIEMTLFTPAKTERNGVIYFIHGGGQVAGDRFALAHELVQKVADLGVKAVSVEYRLSPEFPFPTALHDCYQGLRWAHGHSGGGPLVIYGISAGAGLAAGVTVLAREKGDVRIDGQLLSQPMLDYRTTSETRARVGPVTWTFAHNRDAWQMILRDVDTSAVSALASPALLDDFTDLPSAFIDIGTEDIFLDEAMSYAMRLSSAGISTELHIWGGGYHGFDALDPTADISRLSRATRGQWLERVFA